jgi:hypothetical protein
MKARKQYLRPYYDPPYFHGQLRRPTGMKNIQNACVKQKGTNADY